MTNNTKTFVKLAAVVVIIAVCLVALPARAESEGLSIEIVEVDIGPGDVALFIGVTLAGGYVIIGGLVVAIGNLNYGIKGERASSGWRIQGWVLGSINIALGAVALGLGISSGRFNTARGSTLLFAIGAMDIGFTIWSSSYPERDERLTLSPIVMQDVEGNPAVGIGLNLVDW